MVRLRSSVGLEQPPSKRQVAGSSPAGVAKNINNSPLLCGGEDMGEEPSCVGIALAANLSGRTVRTFLRWPWRLRRPEDFKPSLTATSHPRPLQRRVGTGRNGGFEPSGSGGTDRNEQSRHLAGHSGRQASRLRGRMTAASLSIRPNCSASSSRNGPTSVPWNRMQRPLRRLWSLKRAQRLKRPERMTWPSRSRPLGPS